MSKATIGIIIPTWNNTRYLKPAISSIFETKASENLFHIYVVNNGHKESCDFLKGVKDVTVIDADGNLGWEGGLKLGLEYAKEDFIMFLNDDVHIPMASRLWLNKMLQYFIDDKVGIVAPSSNVVMGNQNIFATTTFPVFSAKFAIFFCVLLRRSAIEKAGGIDTSLPGGDDFDMSIRMRDAGYKIIVDKNVFVYHHGFKTGTRVMGDSDKEGGWNSYKYKTNVDTALIRKHGFKKWFETIQSANRLPELNYFTTEDSEGDIIRSHITKKDKVILDVGCGANKTVDRAIGLDLYEKDKMIETLGDKKSVADVEHDVSKPLPFDEGYADVIIARHILEHLPNSISILKGWHKILKPGGKIFIAVPHNKVESSIPMNIEHVHAWDFDSMKTLLETCGFKVKDQIDSNNLVSFISIGVKGESYSSYS